MSRSFGMFRDYTWQNAKPGQNIKVGMETNKSSKWIDLYASGVKTKHRFFDTWLTVGHIPRKISGHCYFFMEGGRTITGHLISTSFKVSPISAGGLDILLLLTFTKLMRDLAKDWYSYDYTGENNGDGSDEDEEVIINLRDDKVVTKAKKWTCYINNWLIDIAPLMMLFCKFPLFCNCPPADKRC